MGDIIPDTAEFLILEECNFESPDQQQWAIAINKLENLTDLSIAANDIMISESFIKTLWKGFEIDSCTDQFDDSQLDPYTKDLHNDLVVRYKLRSLHARRRTQQI